MAQPPDKPRTQRNAVIVALAARQLAKLWPRVDWASAKAIDAVTTVYGAIVTKFGRMAAGRAAADYDAQRARHRLPGRYRAKAAAPISEPHVAAIVASAFRGRETKASDEPPVDRPVDERVQAVLDAALSGLVRQPARETIVANVAKDPAKPTWIRVPTGARTCELCTVLASRELGPHFSGYASKENALFKSDGAKYHPGCDCEAVAVFPGDDAHQLSPNMRRYQELYYQASAAAGTSSDLNAIIREMRRLPLVLSADRIEAPAGRLPDAKPTKPPSLKELMPWVSPGDGDDDTHFKAKERTVADWLRNEGLTVKSIPIREHGKLGKTPDAVISRFSSQWHPMDFKILESADAAAVTRNLREARRQAKFAVIDGNPIGLTRETAERGLRDAVRKFGLDFTQIVIRLGDNSAIYWANE